MNKSSPPSVVWLLKREQVLMEMDMEIAKKNYDTIAQHPAGDSLPQILTNIGFDVTFF